MLISLQALIRLGQRIKAFNVEAWDGTGWRQICTGTSIGATRLVPLSPTQSPVSLTLSEFGPYKRAE